MNQVAKFVRLLKNTTWGWRTLWNISKHYVCQVSAFVPFVSRMRFSRRNQTSYHFELRRTNQTHDTSLTNVERLFGNAKLIMTDQRRCIYPSTWETILMLKLNKDFWTHETFNESNNVKQMKGRQKDETATLRRCRLLYQHILSPLG
jgi:hypothetical protein